MINDPGPEFTDIEELATIPLSELVEPQNLELPQEYLQDLTDRGVITEGLPTIDIDNALLEGPELEQLPFNEPSVDINEVLDERDFDFGR